MFHLRENTTPPFEMDVKRDVILYPWGISTPVLNCGVEKKTLLKELV